MVFWDQTVLNAVLWNRWADLDMQWNRAPEHTLGRFSLYPLGRARGENIH